MSRREICILGLTLSVVQHTNVQPNCPVLWDQKITKLPIEFCNEAFGENSGGVVYSSVLGTRNIHKTSITLLAWLAICNIISQERREY